MEERKLGPVELRFAELIWDNAPIPSGELVKLCARELEWKKSTTYTVLKKLCAQEPPVCSRYLLRLASRLFGGFRPRAASLKKGHSGYQGFDRSI